MDWMEFIHLKDYLMKRDNNKTIYAKIICRQTAFITFLIFIFQLTVTC